MLQWKYGFDAPITQIKDKYQREKVIKSRYYETGKRVQTLTPAGKKLLLKMLHLFNRHRGDGISRPEIAKALGRPGGLTPHDRKLLKQLEQQRLIDRKREAMAFYQENARGAQFVYYMDENTAYILNLAEEQAHKND